MIPYLLGTRLLRVMMCLVNQEIMWQYPIINTSQVNLIETSCLVCTIAYKISIVRFHCHWQMKQRQHTNEAFLTPRSAFLFEDDIWLIGIVVVNNLVGFI